MATELSIMSNELELRVQTMGAMLRTKSGDRVVVIREGLSFKIFVNNEFKVEVNGLFATRGPIAELFAEAHEAFGDFLADARVEEDGQINFTFYPRCLSFRQPLDRIDSSLLQLAAVD